MSKKPINLTKENGVTYARVADLFLFEDNPRDVEVKDYERLKEQIKLGEHSPLLVTNYGEVLGGNTRLRAYQDLKKEYAKVVVVEIVEADKAVAIVIDGKKSERTFETANQAKIELSLSHNDSIGKYNELKVAELLTVNKVKTDIYSVSTNIVPVEAIVNRAGPDDNNDSSELNSSEYKANDEDVLECPRCGFEIPREPSDDKSDKPV